MSAAPSNPFVARRTAVLVGVSLSSLVMTCVFAKVAPGPTVTAIPASADTDTTAAAAPVSVAGSTTTIRTLARTTTDPDLPAAASATYQRAALVIDAASVDCHLDWTLLAAIGGVESDHGRRGKAVDGRVVGPAQDGSGSAREVPDTDGGELDGDTTWDHPVGPLQLLPATWRTVGVDGDGDGVRDPQDLDDAALAAAVYLCGAGGDLATEEGRRAALSAYDASAPFVDAVLRLAAVYAAAETVVPAVETTAVRVAGPAPVVPEPVAAPAAGGFSAVQPSPVPTPVPAAVEPPVSQTVPVDVCQAPPLVTDAPTDQPTADATAEPCVDDPEPTDEPTETVAPAEATP